LSQALLSNNLEGLSAVGYCSLALLFAMLYEKDFLRTNVVAYLSGESVRKANIFIKLAPRANVIRLFTAINFGYF